MKISSFLFLLALIVLVGCKDDDESLIEVEACFDYMPESNIETGEKVRFFNCSENATAFEWDFGDGSVSEEEEPDHRYSRAGEFIVTLIVEAKSVRDTTWRYIEVNTGSSDNELEEDEEEEDEEEQQSSLEACIDVSSLVVNTGTAVAFYNCSENGNQYLWDFGDGTTSSQENPEHSFSEPGEYIVELFVSNGDEEVSDQVVITVEPQNSEQGNGFSTFAFDAAVAEVTSIIPSGMASALAADGTVHIAWIEKKNNVFSLMHSSFFGGTLETRTVYEGSLREVVAAPSITLDNNDNPHITWFVKRDNEAGSKSGNYAVYYADPLQNQVQQVSANPADPLEDEQNIYNCYVNGRPKITNKNGVLYIFYFSESSSATVWDNHIISAEKSGTSWILNQEYNIDDVAHVSLDIGMTFSIYSDASLSHGFIDISDDDPFVAEKGSHWNSRMIEGYTGWTENDDVHIDLVNSSEYYLTWLNSRNTPMFVEYNLNTGQLNEYPVENTPAGNLFPATKDIVTGDFYGFYCESWSSERYLKIVKGDGTDEEVLFDGIGVPMGKRVLNARNGKVALVTGDEDTGKVYVTVSGLVY